VYGSRRLGAVGDAELGEDVGYVHAGGLVADEQRVGDLPIGAALGYPCQHLPLPRGQAKPVTRRRWLRCGTAGRGGHRFGRHRDPGAAGQQFDLAQQRRRPEPVGGRPRLPQCLRGLLAGDAALE